MHAHAQTPTNDIPTSTSEIVFDVQCCVSSLHLEFDKGYKTGEGIHRGKCVKLNGKRQVRKEREGHVQNKHRHSK